jgi:ABC-type enterochelin transport system substrate-binding protein
MATVNVDAGELEYLRSCCDKLEDIATILNEGQKKNEKKKSPEGKLKEIKKIIKS